MVDVLVSRIQRSWNHLKFYRRTVAGNVKSVCPFTRSFGVVNIIQLNNNAAKGNLCRGSCNQNAYRNRLLIQAVCPLETHLTATKLQNR